MYLIVLNEEQKGVAMAEGIGDQFQKETKYSRKKMSGGYLNWSKRPEVYKVYDDAAKIELEPFLPLSVSLEEVLKHRKSVRRFSDTLLTVTELSCLLWACTGIQRKEQGYAFRTAPSAGALYPLETYIVVHKVEDIERGVYHYNIRDNVLEELKKGDFRRDITNAALGQRMCLECAVVFVWTAVFYRCKWKYKQRAYRYIYLDAGHLAQNLALAAVGLGLGSCQIGALFDDEVNALLGIDGVEESTVYMSVVGHPL
jgi:SagB-type dehydrogenase family enzyme